VKRCFAEGISKALISRYVGTSDSLASERTYTFRTLPQGVWQGLKDFVKGDPSGIGRAFAIVLGLGLTVMGFAYGHLQRIVNKSLNREQSHDHELIAQNEQAG